MKRLLYDARHIVHVHSGLARYTTFVLFALCEEDLQGIELHILLEERGKYVNNPHFERLLSIISNRRNVILHHRRISLFKFQHHIRGSLWVNKLAPDLYFYPYFDAPMFVSCKTVFVVHDLFVLLVKNYVTSFRLAKSVYYRLLLQTHLARKNMSCLTVSRSTRNDVNRIFHGGISNVVRFVHESSFLPADSPSGNNFDSTGDGFLLYVGDRRPHKNLSTMFAVFRLLRDEFNYNGRLVIVGGTRNFCKEHQGFSWPDVQVLSNVDDRKLRTLYKRCDALLLLSTYEGFGLPIVEAGILGRKVVSCSTSSMIEVAPDWALLVDPYGKPSEIAADISVYLSSSISPNVSLYARRFSWSDSAKMILSYFG